MEELIYGLSSRWRERPSNNLSHLTYLKKRVIKKGNILYMAMSIFVRKFAIVSSPFLAPNLLLKFVPALI